MRQQDRRRSRPQLETLEPRILYSADAAALLYPGALVQSAEVRLLDADASVALATQSAAASSQATLSSAETRDSADISSEMRREIVFVDTGVEGYVELLAGITADATRDIDVVLIDAHRDGVSQITEALKGRQGLSAIHVLSHGTEGALQLGNTKLDFESLLSNSQSIRSWANALTNEADLLLYGCDLASSADGRALIDALSRLTGADVAASVDPTGSALLGGNWELEYHAGSIDTSLAVDTDVQQLWQGLLPNTAPTLGNGTLAAVNEDTASPAGQTVSTIFTGQFSDPDAGSSFAGIAVVGNTANAGTQGSWQYSSNSGTNWFVIGTVADDATALALDSATLIRFVPVANYNGSPPALVVRGLDNTYAGGFSTTAGVETRVNVDTTTNGGSTAIAGATTSLSTTIAAIADTPSVTDASTNEDTQTTSGLVISRNVADGAETTHFKITNVTNGTLYQNNGTTVIANNAFITFAQGSAGLKFTPAANFNGTASFQIQAATSNVDGGLGGSVITASITVNAVNDQPTISDIAHQSVHTNTTTSAIAFTVGDVETAAGSLTVTGTSSNPTLVTDGNIVFGGSGANRTVTITPVAGQTGTTTITVTVSDGTDTKNDTFILSVTDPAQRVISGTSTIAAGATSVSAAISPVHMGKSFLVFSATVNDGDPSDTQIRGQLTSPTTVTFTRAGNGPEASIKWSVVEYASGVSVQRGTLNNWTTTSSNIALSTIDLTKSIPLITTSIPGTIHSEDDFIRARLSSSTNLELTRIGNNSTATVEWQVIEFTNSVVKMGDLSFLSTDASKTATIAAVDPAKSWLVYTFKSPDGTIANVGQKLIRGVISDATTLTFDRYNTGQALDLTWYLVEFTDETSVQHSSASFGTTETQRNVAITGVSTANSFAVGGAFQRGGSSPYLADDNPGVGWMTLELTSSTNLQITRSLTGSVAADMGWYVIQIPNVAPTISDIANQSIAEDSATSAIAFTVGDVETPAASLTVTATSSDQTLVPDGNIVLGGSGANRTITLTPLANRNGSATITVTVSDGAKTAVDTFLLTVTPVADTPSVTPATTNEDTQTTSGLVISRNVADGAETTHFKITGITNGTLYKNDGVTQITDGTFITFAEGSAGLKFTPAANFNGSASFAIQASSSNVDAGLGGNPVNATITVNAVNDAPVAVNNAYSVNEDTTLVVDWWNTDWARRQQVTFSGNTFVGAQALAAYPVLITLNGGNIDYTQTQDNGADLRFFDADGTPLDYEIEKWDETGNSYVWVKVPQVDTSGTDSITMYYGNASAGAGQNSDAVWSGNGYAAVYHLGETSGTSTADSSANAFSGTLTNGVAPGSGQVGGAQSFDGVNDYVNLGTNRAFINSVSQVTVSAWINPNSVAGTPNILNLSIDNGGTPTTSSRAGFRLNNGQVEVFARSPDSMPTARLDTSTTALPTGTWSHVVAVIEYAVNTITVYVNGVAQATTTNGINLTAGTTNAGNSTNASLGSEDTGASAFYNGRIDEARVSTAARSAAWVKADYLSMTSAFVTLGGAQTAPATSGVLANDADADSISLRSILVSGPTNGSLSLNADGSLRYTPDANFNGTDTFTYKANDGSLDSNVATVTITVNAVNDAPTLGNGTLAAVNEDTASPAGQTVSTIFTGQFGDVDAGASFSGIAIVSNTANAGTQGSWQYSSNSGTNWFAIGAVADDATALAIDSSTLIRFVPVADYNGTPPALSVRGLDNTYVGGFSTTVGSETRVNVDTTTNGTTTPIAAATANLSTSINPVADTPSVTPATTNEDTQTTSGLVISRNVADGAETTHFKITGITNGTLYKNDGVTQISDGSFITFAEGSAGLKFTPTANFNGTASFTIQASSSNVDAGLGGNPVNATITVNAVNDAPINTVPGAQSTSEDTNLVFSSGNGNQISITDPDASGAAFQVTLTVTNGDLTLAGTTGLTFASGDGTADSTMTFRGTVTDVNTALNGLTYSPTADYNGGATLTLSTRDSTLVSLDIDANLQARYTFEGNANDVAPGTAQNGTLMNGASLTINATRGQVLSLDGVNDFVDLSAHTADFSGLTQGTISGWIKVTSTFETIFSISDTADTGSYAALFLGASGYLTYEVMENGVMQLAVFRSSATIHDGNWHHVAVTIGPSGNSLYVDGALATAGQLTYDVGNASTQRFFSSVSGLDSMAIGRNQDSSGGKWYATGNLDDIRLYDRVLTATEVANLANDLALTDTDTVAVTVNPSNDPPVVTSASLTVNEGQTVTLSGANFGITDPDDSAFTYTVSSISGGYFQLTSAIGTPITTFTSADLSGNLVQFVDDGNEVAPSFSVKANDGDVDSNTLAATVTYNPQNDAPVVTSASLTVNEGQTVTLSGANFGITDPDDASFTYTVSSISGGYFQLTSAIGTPITTFTSADLSGNLVQFVDDGNEVAPSFSVKANDGDVDSNTLAATLTYNAVNDPPIISSNGGGASAAIIVAENTLAVTTVTSFDVDGGTPVYSILPVGSGGAADAAKFTINSSTGVLSFIAAPDFEAPTDAGANNVYDVTVQVSDGAGGIDTQLISVTVTDLDEFDVTTPVDANAAANAVNENAANGTVVGITAFAADADATTNAISYSLTDTAGGRFAIDASSGVVTVANGTLLNRETAASHTITVQATSADGSSASEMFTITLNDVDEAPQLTTPGPQAVDEDAVLAIGGISVSDPEANLASVQLTVASGRLDVLAQGGAIIAAGSNGSPTLTLAGTQAAINATLATLTYQGDAHFNSADALNIVVTDSGGLTATALVPIVVRSVNDAPTGTIALSGTPIQGQVLSADTSAIADADGLGVFAYLWQRSGDGGANWVDIGGANSAAYALTAADAGSLVRTSVSYTDAQGTAERVDSAPVAVTPASSSASTVTAPPPEAISAPLPPATPVNNVGLAPLASISITATATAASPAVAASTSGSTVGVAASEPGAGVGQSAEAETGAGLGAGALGEGGGSVGMRPSAAGGGAAALGGGEFSASSARVEAKGEVGPIVAIGASVLDGVTLDLQAPLPTFTTALLGEMLRSVPTGSRVSVAGMQKSTPAPSEELTRNIMSLEGTVRVTGVAVLAGLWLGRFTAQAC